MRTERRNRLLSALLVLGLATGTGGVHAAGPHEGHAVAHAEVRLEEGRRWPTDEPLRQGMSDIRRAMAAAFPAIHMRLLPEAEYAALAATIQERVDHVARNCRLPEAADAELHGVLASLVEGSDALRGSDRVGGAMRVIQALGAYGRRFDHPDWAKTKAL